MCSPVVVGSVTSSTEGLVTRMIGPCGCRVEQASGGVRASNGGCAAGGGGCAEGGGVEEPDTATRVLAGWCGSTVAPGWVESTSAISASRSACVNQRMDMNFEIKRDYNALT